jgi:hypothetical protein
MECRLAGETEVLGENLPQRHFCPSQNPTWPDQGLNLGHLGGKPATNRLSYGAAFVINNWVFDNWKSPYSTYDIYMVNITNNVSLPGVLLTKVFQFKPEVALNGKLIFPWERRYTWALGRFQTNKIIRGWSTWNNYNYWSDTRVFVQTCAKVKFALGSKQ